MKTVLTILIFSLLAQASEGYQVYRQKCSSCHVELMSRSEALKNLKQLKAPPMIEVSNRLKENIVIADGDGDIKRRVVIAFIKDYIVNPDLMYSMCNPGALETFGVMPSLKGKITEQERQNVAEWVYDRYQNVKFE